VKWYPGRKVGIVPRVACISLWRSQTTKLRSRIGLSIDTGCMWVALSMIQGQNPRSQLLHRQTTESGKPTTDKNTSQISI
jgi:hypothetical protein